jgi:hypothetical protein
MFRQITAIVLFISFAAQVFDRNVAMLDYILNPAPFAKNCENKMRPMLHCNGKCQLMKKLREQEKKDQQNPERKTENKNEVTSSRSYFASIPLYRLNIPRPALCYSISPLSAGMNTEIFHPPGPLQQT